jgi:hypothetical protein
MNSIVQLSIAILLAIVAAGINWIYLAAQTHPPTYVAVKSDVKQGREIEDDLLMSVPVPGDAERMKQALIPYKNRSILLGTKAARDFQRGDMIFARDVIAPLDPRQWDVIGPFELISVGERFKQGSPRTEGSSNTIRGNTVTIAVDAGFDRETSRLLEAIAADELSVSGAAKPEIVAVQVVPAPGSRLATTRNLQQQLDAAGTSTLPPRDDVVYQTVSLEGIPNVPLVLLEGDLIRFVVPRRPGG